MTISSGATAPNPVLAYRAAAPAASADDVDKAMIRQRFAGMLGLNPDQLADPPSDSVSLSPKAKEVSVPRQEAAASDTISPPVTPVTPGATPLTRELSGPTFSAGTVVDGMVSAGPTSAGLAGMTGIIPEATGTHLIAVASDAQKFDYDPIAMIRDRLAKLGVNPGNLQLERWVDTVSSPGGQRVNQYVRGTIGGVSENFAVERVLQNPDITAVEIQGLLQRAV